jgi:ABC-type transport system substrate-binding protein
MPPDDGNPSFRDQIGAWLDPGGQPSLLFRRCCVSRTLLSYQVTDPAAGGSELVPDLASELPTVSADGLTWEFHLRPGLHYAPPFQQTEITSADVVRAIERVSRGDQIWPGIAGLAEFQANPIAGLAGLETPDATTLRVRLDRPDGDFAQRMAFTASSPIPAAALGANGELTSPVSTGPYMLDAASVTDRSAALVRNPSWSRDVDVLRPASVDRIELVRVDSPEAGLAMVERNELDLVSSFLTPDEYRSALDSGAKAQIVAAQQNVIFHIPLNVANPPTNDVHVRKAIFLVLDRQAITDAIQGERGSLFELANHLFPDAVVNGLLADYNPLSVAGPTGNLPAAQAEMRLSRYDTDRDGRCDRSCRVVIVPFFGSDAPARLVATALGQLGLNATVQTADVSPTPRTRYSMWAVPGWSGFGPIAGEFTQLFDSAGLQRTNEPGANISLLGASRADLRAWGYRGSVPSLDSQIQLCREQRGSSAFRCWAQLDQSMMEKVFALVPIATRLVAYRISTRVESMQMSVTDGLPAIDTVTVRDDAAPTD